MALIKCPDCETEISDKAPACTKCGRPVEKPESEKKSSPLVALGAVLGIVGATLYFTNTGGLYGMMGGMFGMLGGGAMFVTGLFTKSS